MKGPVAVIGAGVSGLAAALELQRVGIRPVVFEGAPHPGGTIHSTRDQGYLCEHGPYSLLDREPALRSLIDSLRLGSRVLAASPRARRRYLCLKGRLTPLTPPALLGSRILGVSAKLRALAEVAVPRGPGGEESVAAFVARRFGSSVSKILVDAMIAGIYAGDSERLSIRSAFPKIWELERMHRSVILGGIREARRASRAAKAGAKSRGTFSFDRGVQVLTDAVAAELGDAVHLGARVETVKRRPEGLRVAVTESSGLREVDVAAAVVALPAHAAGAVLKDLAPGVGGILNTIPYAPVAVVHLGYPVAEAGNSGDGFGFLAPRNEPLKMLGCIFASTVFPDRSPPGHALLTAFVGGSREPALVSLPDAELATLVADDLRKVMATGTPVFQRVVKHAKAIPQYEVGHGARLAALDAVLAGMPGVFLAGNAYRGVSVSDCVREAPIVARAAASYVSMRSAA